MYGSTCLTLLQYLILRKMYYNLYNVGCYLCLCILFLYLLSFCLISRCIISELLNIQIKNVELNCQTVLHQSYSSLHCYHQCVRVFIHKFNDIQCYQSLRFFSNSQKLIVLFLFFVRVKYFNVNGCLYLLYSYFPMPFALFLVDIHIYKFAVIHVRNH